MTNYANSAQLLIHVGLPKTATTTLQKHVFRNLMGTKVLTMHNPKTEHLVTEFKNFMQSETYDQTHAEALRNAALTDTGRLFLTEEEITFPDRVDIMRSPEWLKRLFGDAVIFFVIRNQFDWLESYYIHTQSRKCYKVLPEQPEEFFQREIRENRYKARELLEYDSYVKHWRDVYGHGNVNVVPFEWLGEDPLAFFNVFASHLEENPELLSKKFESAKTENSRKSSWHFYDHMRLRRARNKNYLWYRILKSSQAWRAPRSTEKLAVEFRLIVDPDTVNSWKIQNYDLSKHTGIDLGHLGYPM